MKMTHENNQNQGSEPQEEHQSHGVTSETGAQNRWRMTIMWEND